MINGPLPLTGIKIREETSIAGARLVKVLVFGYSKKPEFWRESDCKPIVLSDFMLDQINGWLRNVGLTSDSISVL